MEPTGGYKTVKSPRNKTIDITVEEGKEYLDKCINVCRPIALHDVLDKTIQGYTNGVFWERNTSHLQKS